MGRASATDRPCRFGGNILEEVAFPVLDDDPVNAEVRCSLPTPYGHATPTAPDMVQAAEWIVAVVFAPGSHDRVSGMGWSRRDPVQVAALFKGGSNGSVDWRLSIGAAKAASTAQARRAVTAAARVGSPLDAPPGKGVAALLLALRSRAIEGDGLSQTGPLTPLGSQRRQADFRIASITVTRGASDRGDPPEGGSPLCLGWDGGCLSRSPDAPHD